ncbi:MAG: hypothetical protein K2H13_01175 [Eubacterium sp.]|nr:hypothetical protein [Eubacterium sp.]MDE6767000.1 hypothetical protein [Eubacterium sp.]
MFIEAKKRVGSCYFEFQYCKIDSPIKNNKVDVDIIQHWKYDSLLISDENFFVFYKLYADMFSCALLANGKISFDFYGPNYYDSETAEKLLKRLIGVIDDEYNNLILWLEKAVKECNGFYILGI